MRARGLPTLQNVARVSAVYQSLHIGRRNRQRIAPSLQDKQPVNAFLARGQETGKTYHSLYKQSIISGFEQPIEWRGETLETYSTQGFQKGMV
jgi:hypothetical protein